MCVCVWVKMGECRREETDLYGCVLETGVVGWSGREMDEGEWMGMEVRGRVKDEEYGR